MAVYKVEICGVNTSKLPLLKNEEKEMLFRRIQEGDAEAREEYIKGNLRLVLSVIQRFAGNGDNMDDLFQIGCIGLIKAIDNFDVSQNVKFSTYAVPMDMGEGKAPARGRDAGARRLFDMPGGIYFPKGRELMLGREPTLSPAVRLNGRQPAAFPDPQSVPSAAGRYLYR